MCDANQAGRHAGQLLADLLAAERIDPIIVEPPADLSTRDGAPVIDLNAWAQIEPDWATQLEQAIDGLDVTREFESPGIERGIDD